MAAPRINLLMVMFFLASMVPLYAQKNEDIYNEEWLKSQSYKTESAFKKNLLGDSFSKDLAQEQKNFFGFWFNSQAIAAPPDVNTERIKLREDWKEFLGIDIFYPYFKAKEVENFVKEKTAINFFTMKGRPEFHEGSNEVRYIFKKKF
jgi:hypothetical protein